MYSSPSLKVLAAQSIVNNDITLVEIPIHLKEEMCTLKKMQQIQQLIKYGEGVIDLLIRLLNRLSYYIYFADSNYTNMMEDGLDVDKYLKYFKECNKWFSTLYYKVISILHDKEDEVEVIQNSLPLEYHNITFNIIQIVNEDDGQIYENINEMIEYLIDKEYRITESDHMKLYEQEQRLWGHHPSQQASLKNMYESITEDRKYAMTVLYFYKLYYNNE